MEKKTFHALALALGATLLSASLAHATLVVPGSYQIANGGTVDWSPETAPAMTETGPSTGIFTLNLAGLAGATQGTHFQFKILDDQDSPPAGWGDPELTPGNNSWFLTDNAGSATITVDRNTYNDGFFPATNRVAVSTDAAVVTGFFATGSWMTEAGGAGDWTNNDPMFQMTAQGGGLYSVNATISTPGPYEWKVTDGSWDNQWGADGRKITNASNLTFNTFTPNQQVTFSLDLAKGAIGYSTLALLAGDTNNNGVIEFEEDFGPIRDNFLNLTNLRAEGDLTLDGVVDVLDFHEWKTAWLANGGTPAQIASAFASLSIPEPAAATLVLAAGVGLAAIRRRRRR